MRARFLAAACGAILAVGALPLLGAGAQADPASVYVVHGLDLGDGPGGFPVTVCVDDAVLLPDLTTGQVEGPVELEQGTYNVEVTAGADAGCDAPTLQQDFDVPEGANLSIVAYFEFDSGPTLGAFENDVACTEAGNARVTARHTANAGPVDVLANGEVLFADVANGQGADADVPTGTYGVAADLVGGGSVIPATDVELPEAANTIAYVIGGSDSAPSVVVQSIDLETCSQPTTTTAPSPTSPVAPQPARPATAAQAQPAVTG